MASTSTPKLCERRTLRGSSLGHDRSQLHDRVVALALHPAGARNDAVLVEQQVRSVEEEDLADLGLQRVHAEGADGRRDGRMPGQSASARRCRSPSSTRAARRAPHRYGPGAAWWRSSSRTPSVTGALQHDLAGTEYRPAAAAPPPRPSQALLVKPLRCPCRKGGARGRTARARGGVPCAGEARAPRSPAGPARGPSATLPRSRRPGRRWLPRGT